jgi:hypothetical protein
MRNTMTDKDKEQVTPDADVKLDAEGVMALVALLTNAANQGTSGSLASVLGNAAQMAASSNSSQTSTKDNADINVPESMSAYVGLAVNNATSHQGRVMVQAEQIMQDAITAGKQITQNAITQANSVVTDSTSQRNKREVDQGTVADFLHFQGIRGEGVAQDRIWNIDEQVAAATVLWAALGKFIGSQDVEA